MISLLTVGQFIAGLDNPRLHCVAGFRGLNRELSSFSVVDTPEILKWLRGGEFVVDAGYITKTCPGIIPGLIRALREKGCAAYGLKIHRYFDEIPPEILEEGDRYDFPVVAIPYETPFCDFAYALHKYVFQYELGLDQAVSQLYIHMISAFCKYQSPDRLLYELHIILEDPVLLLDGSFRLLGMEADEESRRQLPALFRLEARVPVLGEALVCELQKQQRDQGFLLRQFTVSGPERGVPCAVAAIPRGEGGSHYLLIPELKKELESWQLQLLQNVSTLFALALRGSGKDAGSCAPSSFVSQVLLPDSVSPSVILQQCKLCGFNYEDKRVCLVIRFRSYLQTSMVTRNALQGILSQLRRELSRTYGGETYHTDFNDDQILYLFFPKETAAKDAAAQAAEAAERIHETLGKYGFESSVGVSSCREGLDGIAAAFHEALDAMDLGTRLYPGRSVHLFARYQICHWLSTTCTKSELQKLYDDTVRPLRESSGGAADYVAILEAYINSQYNVSRAARSLFIHRNTMNNYLEDIRALLSVDLSDAQSVFRLQVGIYAMRLLGL
ncbi:MAG: PucR family transcriptional regulator [Oscillospiraceae bacterium]